MSNVIELRFAEIDSVVGGIGARQEAMIQQASLVNRPTDTMLHIPSKTVSPNGSLDIGALLARMEARR